MTVSCPHRPPCPGCPALGRTLDALPVVEELAELARRQGASLALMPSAEPRGYRHRARLAIRGSARAPQIGIFEAGSHRVVDIPRCLVHHPAINAVARAIAGAVRETGLAPYADATHRGLLRYAQVAIDRAGERVQLTLVTNSRAPEPAAALWPALQARLDRRLQGLFWNGQPERTNTILGPHWRRIAGAPALDERIAGARVFLPPDAFMQNNPLVYERIVQQIGAWSAGGRDVLELYAGVGAIGLSLLPRAARVRFNELAAGSLAGLRMGLSALPSELAARTEVLSGRAGAHAPLLAGTDLVIVDPPRKGLDAELLGALCDAKSAPRELLYLSCGPKALIAEAERMQPCLRLRQLLLFDLFPWTGHVEALARFERNRPACINSRQAPLPAFPPPAPRGNARALAAGLRQAILR